jgi:hypothetical protein
VPREARALVAVLRQYREEVLKVLQARTCYSHGDRAKWWNRPNGSPVCGLCHPDPFDLTVQRAKSSGAPEMPAGLRLLDWKPKLPPAAITTWVVVNDVPQFVQTTLAQLEAALRGDNWVAGNWSVRDLLELLEQAGIKVEVESRGRDQV